MPKHIEEFFPKDPKKNTLMWNHLHFIFHSTPWIEKALFRVINRNSLQIKLGNDVWRFDLEEDSKLDLKEEEKAFLVENSLSEKDLEIFIAKFKEFTKTFITINNSKKFEYVFTYVRGAGVIQILKDAGA